MSFNSHFSATNQLWDQQMKPALDAFQTASEASEVLLDAGPDTAQKAVSALTWFLLSTAEIGTPQT
jgi:hypothetical protein